MERYDMEQVFKIGGMSCGGCVASVERAAGALSGVQLVKVDLANANATVQFDASKVSVEKIQAAIEDAGYDVFTA